MQDPSDRSNPSSSAEGDMLDSYHGGRPAPNGNPAAADAANAARPALDRRANPDGRTADA